MREQFKKECKETIEYLKSQTRTEEISTLIFDIENAQRSVSSNLNYTEFDLSSMIKELKSVRGV